jgi:anaerobic magnesium-protoporphyrin IX monomethyl ester cyclase
VEAIGKLVDTFYNSGRFATVLRALAATESLSAFFAAAARGCEGNRNFHFGTSQNSAFETLWNCIRFAVKEERHEKLRDALCYDFCLHEYPVAGNTPSFFGENNTKVPKSLIHPYLEQMNLLPGAKVRTFVKSFATDYTYSSGNAAGADILFVYASAPGKGLTVTAVKFG